MLTGPKIIVLRVFEPFLDMLTCTSAENFENAKKRTQNIIRAIVLGSLSACFVVIMAVDLLYCYGLEFDLRVTAFPFAILINDIQLVLTYASFWTNSERVKQTIDTLTEMVTKRE